MKHLTATICLTLVVLLFSPTEGWSLPPCPEDPSEYYNNCFGTYTVASGAKYVGEWKDNKKHGQGTSTFANGHKYVGEFRDDKFHGQGTYTSADGHKYVGEFRDDNFHGQGTYTYADGHKYVGEFRDNNYHGQGIRYAADGTVLQEGYWENDELVRSEKIEGRDTSYAAQSDLPPCPEDPSEYYNNCFGTYTVASGDKYVGEWKDNKKHGQGTYTWPDGSKYVGEFQNDMFSGLGTLYTANGTVRKKGQWENGELVRSEGEFVGASAAETKCNEIRGPRYPAKILISSSVRMVKLNHGDYSNRGNDAYQMGDPAAALCWWKPLAMAQQSSDIAVEATHNIGVLYKEGYGVEKDHKIAMIFFRQAAEQHYTISQYELGELYEKGEGIVVDLMESAKWYRLAARMEGGPADVDIKEKYAALAIKALEQPKFSNAASKTKAEELRKELGDYYIAYITINECNKVSSQYIDNSQIEAAKSKISSIQDYYEEKYKNMDTASVWESSSAVWEEKFGGSFALFSALGVYSEELNGICRLQLLSFSTANVPGAEEQKRERDFD